MHGIDASLCPAEEGTAPAFLLILAILLLTDLLALLNPVVVMISSRDWFQMDTQMIMARHLSNTVVILKCI